MSDIFCVCGHESWLHVHNPIRNRYHCQVRGCPCNDIVDFTDAPDEPQTWDDLRTEAAQRERNGLAQRAYLAIIAGYHARMGLQMPDNQEKKAMCRLAVAYAYGWKAYRGD